MEEGISFFEIGNHLLNPQEAYNKTPPTGQLLKKGSLNALNRQTVCQTEGST